MKRPSSKTKIAGRVVIAHAAGLWTAGMVGTIGTTAGFSIAGGGLGLFLGGILSIPWIVALAAIIWFYGSWIDKHPFLFAFIGPMAVCGSYALLGGAFLDAVAVSSITSSACYLALVVFGGLQSAKATKI